MLIYLIYSRQSNIQSGNIYATSMFKYASKEILDIPNKIKTWSIKIYLLNIVYK